MGKALVRLGWLSHRATVMSRREVYLDALRIRETRDGVRYIKRCRTLVLSVALKYHSCELFIATALLKPLCTRKASVARAK